MTRARRVGRVSVLAGVLLASCGPKDGPADGGAGGSGSGAVAGTGGGSGAGGGAGSGGAIDAAVTADASRDGRPADAAAPIDAPGTADAGAGAEAGPDSGPPAVRLTPLRTYAFHELTALTSAPTSRPALSADGKVIAFAQGLSQPNRVVVSAVNADGTGLREVDRYEALCFCAGTVEISADGQVVVSTDSAQVRRAGAAMPMLALESNEIWDIRLTADGTRVFVLLRRDATVRGTVTRLERGVWVVNVDGTGLRQVTGAAAMAAAFATPLANVFPISGCGRSLAISNDGGRVVFAANLSTATMNTESVFAVGGDGSGLRKLVDATGGFRLVQEIGLSGDGNKVAYHVYTGNNVTELGVIDFGGGGRRMLAATPEAGCQNRLNLTTDGSKLHVSEPGLVYQTDGSGVLSLSIAAFRPVGAAPVKDGTPWGRMSSDGKRFSLTNPDDKQIPQLMVLDLDPAALGAAPTLSDPTFSHATLPPSALTMATATVRATGPGLMRVGLVFAAGGLWDVIDRGPGVALNDAGRFGDLLSGDGIYTGHDFAARSTPTPGPRTLRFTAESRSGERRHATVLEASGVAIQ